MDGKKQEYMNFEKEMFITYMNDLPFNKTCDYSTLNRLKQESIDLRKDFFKLFFFKSFPVIILATDSYPHKYNFSIEDSFGRYWRSEERRVGKECRSGWAWYQYEKSI